MLCFGFLVMICQAQERPPAIDTYCANYRPVYLSRRDTRQTKEQVDLNNRAWKAVCRGR